MEEKSKRKLSIACGVAALAICVFFLCGLRDRGGGSLYLSAARRVLASGGILRFHSDPSARLPDFRLRGERGARWIKSD